MVYGKEGKTHSLIIKKAQLNDEGLYNVKAVNEAGETVAKATLTVNGTVTATELMMLIRLTYVYIRMYHICTYIHTYVYVGALCILSNVICYKVR